jgi:S1-C subfamily serine protease
MSGKHVGLHLSTAPRRWLLAVGAPAGHECLISAILPGGPAEHAGLAEGDVILRMGNRDVANVDDVGKVLAATSVGTEVPVTVFRVDPKTGTGREVQAKLRVEQRK